MNAKNNISDKLAIITAQQTKEREYWFAEMSGEPVKSFFYYDYPESGDFARQMEAVPFQLTGDPFDRLMRLSNNYDYTLYMILVSGLIVLLDKYTYGSNKDILLGAPIYKQEVEGDLINTVLPLRNHLEDRMTFKELLLQVKDTIVEANKHQNFPIEAIVEYLDMSLSEEDFPLFDIAILLENIHDREYLRDIPLNMIFSLERMENCIAGVVEYNATRYRAETIMDIVYHFTRVLEEAIANIEGRVSDINILSEQEKKRLLIDFNASAAEYPREKAIHQLFGEQAEKSGDSVALVGMAKGLSLKAAGGLAPLSTQGYITYRQLNEKSLQLTRLLIEKGVKPGTQNSIVGIMSEGSPEILAGILGILRASGAYLPISPHYPESRKKYLAADSNIKILLTDSPVTDYSLAETIIDVNDPGIYRERYDIESAGSFENPVKLAYIMYTSGSTGIPKGSLIEHKSVVRLVKNTNFVDLKEDDRILKTGAMEFDASTFEIWGALLNGLRVYLERKDIILIPEKLKERMNNYRITTMWMTAPLFNQMVDADIEIFAGLRNLLVGGDVLSPPHILRVRNHYPHLKVINGYGPTENTTFSTTHLIDRDYKGRIPIGKPIANSTAYIVDKNFCLVPPGAVGELLVGGDGVARGYLNSPELTADKFIKNQSAINNILTHPTHPTHPTHLTHPLTHSPIYRTGDLARWLPDGTVDFLGRIDFQVKIRGFRVEMGEIENHLLNHDEIREAVVIARHEQTGGQYSLAAYVVGNRQFEPSELREYLSRKLPDYMIPGYFISLDKMPLTPNGKIDRKALPEPELKVGEDYIAPANEVEEKLTEIWSEILGIDKNLISVAADFFDLGGHSLRANVVVSEIHKFFNVKIPLVEIFTTPTIRGLAEYISAAGEEWYAVIEPAEEREYYALSPAQKRLYLLHQMEPDSVNYNMPHVVPFPAEVDKEKLAWTFKELIKRHESLRTSFEVVGEEPVQRIHEALEFSMEHGAWSMEGRDFVRPFDLSQAPLLRVALMETGGNALALLIDMHHIISDGASQALLTGEFNRLYSGKGEGLPPLPLQYKDYALWQNSEENRVFLKEQESYWLKVFSDEIPVLNLPLDFPRPAVQSFEGNTIDIKIDDNLASRLNQLVHDQDVTLYMVLLALFNVFLCKLSGQEDIVIGTPVSGRRHGDVQGIMGLFVNTLAVRNFPHHSKSFVDFLKEVKSSSVEAFEHQEYPFEELVEKVEVQRDPGRNPLFDVMFALERSDTAGVADAAPESHDFASDYRVAKFDLTLTAMESSRQLVFSFEYCTRLFKEQTMQRFIDYFLRIVATVVEHPELPLGEIYMVGEEEQSRILYEFNDTAAAYPDDHTLVPLFHRQVERTPLRTAVTCGFSQLTYDQLNKRGNRLAFTLKQKGVGPDILVGILTDRSLEMIVAVLGVLKAGGGYLALDAESPENRIQYIIEDSQPALVLVNGDVSLPETMDFNGQCLWLPDAAASGTEDGNPEIVNSSDHLAYILYTSGTTGRPKGVMIDQGNAVAYVHAFLNEFPLRPEDNVILEAAFIFDVFAEEVYPPLLSGSKICVAQKEEVMDVFVLESFIARYNITHFTSPPLLLNELNRLASLDNLRTVHTFISGVDVLKEEYISRLRGPGRFYNVYGPTEATVSATYYKLPEELAATIPIGKPIANYRVYILDKSEKLQGIGVPGEICICGDGVGRGYLNQPELTHSKFQIPNSPLRFSASQLLSFSLYRTGDLGRWLPDGNIEFLGRIDLQVKIRGFRVELGEIESQLSAIDKIKEAVVIAVKEGSGEMSLCAYVVPAEGESVDILQLRHTLSRNLPAYMVPSYIVSLEKMPLTPSGKVDKRALPEPEAEMAGEVYIGPRNPVEKTLVHLWSEVLGVDKEMLSIDANFFQLGGHSLKANLLVTRINRVLAVKIPLTELFKTPSIRGLAEFIKAAEGGKFSPIETAEEKAYYPLSSVQKRLFVLHQIAPLSVAYHMTTILGLEGELDKARLEDCFSQLIRRHESLRTSFEVMDGEPVQEIRGEVDFEIEYIATEITEGTEEEKHHHSSFIIHHLVRQFIHPFDLLQAPLLRVGLIETGEREHTLVVDMHHIISDGTSVAVLVAEFMSLYEGKKLPGLHLHYKDYAQWENREREGEAVKRQEAFWLKEFADDIPILELPTDFPRPKVQDYEGSTLIFEIGSSDTRGLKALALEEGATLYMVLLAIYNIFLSRLSGQEVIVVGTPTGGRPHADLERVIGMFVNTLALKNEPAGEKTFRDFLKEVKEKTLSAFAHQDYPYEELVEKVIITRDSSRNPLFDAMFILQNLEVEEFEIPGLKLKPYPIERTTSKFDFTLEGIEGEKRLTYIVEYSTKLFKVETIERFIIYLKRLTSAVLANPDQRINQLDMVPEEEKEQLAKAFNDTAEDFPMDKTIYQLFEEQVDRYPDHAALVFKDKSVTYRHFDECANQLANYLRGEKGFGIGDRVAVLMERSLELIISLMGVMKGGGAYVPLDPSLPLERLRVVLEDASIGVVLSQEGYREKLTPLLSACQCLHSLLFMNEIDSASLSRPGIVGSGNPAYVMYTSGSSGIPKGVLVEHRTIVNTLLWRRNFYEYSPGNVSLQNPPYFFDSSITDIFTPLIGGARLVLVAEEERVDLEVLKHVLKDYKISHFIAVPAFYNILVEEIPDYLTHVKMVTVAGEHFPDELVKRHFDRLPRVRIFNEYGPTENSVNSTAYELKPDSEKALIGKPISNVGVYILNRVLGLCPLGVTGEICLAGSSLSRGYLNSPELTNKKFLRGPGAVFSKRAPGRRRQHAAAPILHGLKDSLPQINISNKRVPAPQGGRRRHRLHRTGDLARWLPDGNLEFMGRADSQVKIRGIRVEVAEIENHLLKRDDIKEAIVLAHEGPGGDKYLCGYVVPTGIEIGEAGAGEWKQYLAERLPEYMVPSHILVIETIPFTPSGKIDRRSLPAPEVSFEDFTAPRNSIEEELAEIWAGVLGIGRDTIGIDSDFFQLGGHSLRATTVVSRIHKTFNVKIPLAEIFVTPTIRALAKYINTAVKKRYVSIEPVEKREYYPLSPAQRRLYILHRMEPDNVGYNMPEKVSFPGKIDKEKLTRAFKELIKRHESLRTSFEMLGEEPVQRIHDDVEFSMEHGAWSVKGSEFVRPFDLSRAPLLRVGLIESEGAALLIDLHHIITDGTSQAVLTNEFKRLYAGEEEGLPQLRLQYKDYSQWQNSEEQQALIKDQETYWLEMFSDEVPVLNLPYDYSRPLMQSFAGNTVEFLLTVKESQTLKFLAREANATLYMNILAVFTILLSKLSGQEDIVVGTPIAGRRHADLEIIIGVFINTLAMRNYPGGEKRFSAFLEEVKERTLTAHENQEYQFENLVDRINVRRDTGRNPVFDVMFNLLNQDDYTGSPPGIDEQEKGSPYAYKHQKGISKFDLTLSIVDLGDQLLCFFEYCTKLFRPDTIERFIAYFKNLLDLLAMDSNRQLAQLEIVTETERQQLLYEFNNTGAEYPCDIAVHQLFEEQVEKTPDSIAIHSAYRTYRTYITYDQLKRKSNQLARYLSQQRTRENQLVGLLADRSLEMILGILGIWKAGGAYAPLNPKAPASRNGYILNECRANLLLTTRALFEEEEKVAGWDGNIHFIEECKESAVVPLSREPKTSPSDLAYAIFTSGSTGKPKGVPITHSNLCPLLQWGYKHLGIGPKDRAIQNLSYYFDWAVWEIFITLTTGASLYMVPEEILLNPEACIPFMTENDITVLHVTPSQYQGFIHVGHKLESLKYLFLGAEKLTVDLLKRSFASVGEACRVFNMYGPTEATIITGVLEIKRGEESQFETLTSVPIGEPVANALLLVLDKYMKLCPVNVKGELYIAGDGVSHGYLNDPVKTKGVFIRNPYESEGVIGNRLYKTGDLVRWLPDGNVEFFGREDFQVKLRGFRIELGEIENRLLEFAGVKEAVVITRKRENADPYLAAYLVLSSEGEYGEMEVSEVISQCREFLSQDLPDYMVPSFFVPLARMPLNPNGKVDRRALPEPDIGEEAEAYTAPGSAVEMLLAELWSDVLGLEKEKIGIDAHFFQLGGNSLRATTVSSKIHKVFDVIIPLAVIFKTPTIRDLAKYITDAGKERYAAVLPVEKKEYYPLSPAQKRLYVVQQMDWQGSTYNLPSIMVLEGDVHKEKFETIFRQLIQRHESLRTSFETVNNEPVQKIHDRVDFKIPNYKSQITNIIKDFVRPFDLAQAPLIRVGLIKEEEEKYIFMMDMHHIISDGFSMGILVKEFMSLYQGKELPGLRVQYKDYSEWRNSMQVEETLRQQEAFWLKEFEGEIPVLDLPTDYVRPNVQSFEGSIFNFEINNRVMKGLKTFALEEGATLYMVLLAIHNIFLSKVTGQEVLVVGTATAGRPHADLEQVMGMFVNTLALKNKPAGEKTFRDFLKDVKEKTLEAFANQDYPYEELVERAAVNRDTGRNPLFDTAFALQNQDIPEMEIPGLKLKPFTDEHGTAKFDLALLGMETSENLLFVFEYCTKLFRAETIERFSGYFLKIASDVLERPDEKIADIEILSEAERKQILFDFNDTDTDYPREKTIHQLFEEQVAKMPDRIAAVGIGRISVTYSQLNGNANQLARVLREKGVKPDCIVGLMVDRSIQMQVGIMGILKAGGAYLPIPLDYPAERIHYMLVDCSARLLVSEGRKVSEAIEGIDLRDLPTYRLTDSAPQPQQSSSSLAYVIYTSGTTGKPKGTLTKHFNVTRVVKNTNYIRLTADDRVLQLSNYAFDGSVFDIYGALLNGAALVLLEKEKILMLDQLAELIRREQVTVFFVTTALFNALVDFKIECLDNIRKVLFGGERVSLAHTEKALEYLGEGRMIHVYGPTEITVYATYYFIDSIDKKLGTVPIGKPIANTSVYILDKRLKLVPIGTVGEIYIGGDGVARGYLNRPLLTTEKFPPAERPSCLYRTGDLARWLPDGNIEFIGRIDHQIKLRGFRVELGEIESRLLDLEEIREAVVLAREKPGGEKYLAAYIVLSSPISTDSSPLDQLRDYLSRSLPDYMIPSSFVPLDKIPLTSNGKIDHRALPEPKTGEGSEKEYVPPGNEVESKLVKIWSELLEIETDKISINADFFRLGGHSLKAAAMMAKIQETFDIKLDLVEIFSHPTAMEIAPLIKASGLAKEKQQDTDVDSAQEVEELVL